MQTNEIILADSEDRRERATKFDRLREFSFAAHAFAYWRIDEEKLYLELGYHSTVHYAEVKDGYTKSHTYKILKIARSFFPYLKMDAQVNSLELEAVSRGTLFNLPYRKLYQLTRLPELQRQRLVEEGAANMRGKLKTVEELKKLSTEEIDTLFHGKAKNKIVKDPNKIPFKVVYKRAEKIFNILTFDIGHCPVFGKHDIDRIEYHIVKLVEIYDQFVQKIPSNELDKNEIKT